MVHTHILFCYFFFFLVYIAPHVAEVARAMGGLLLLLLMLLLLLLLLVVGATAVVPASTAAAAAVLGPSLEVLALDKLLLGLADSPLSSLENGTGIMGWSNIFTGTVSEFSLA